MMDVNYGGICAQVNAALESRSLIQYIGWLPEKMIRSGDVYLAMCPIHQDAIFRTLVLNPRNNTYICKHVHCTGNSPADFLDLLVKVSRRSLPEVIDDLVTHNGAEHFRLQDPQVKLIKELVRQVQSSRVGSRR